MNKVHSYCNKVVPELLEELSKGFKLTNSFQFYKKDADRFKAILQKYPHFRAYLKTTEFSIMLDTDAHYQVGDCTCNYYGKNIYLYNLQKAEHYNIKPGAYEYTPLKMVTEAELVQAKKRQREIEQEISNLKSKLSTVNRLLE